MAYLLTSILLLTVCLSVFAVGRKLKAEGEADQDKQKHDYGVAMKWGSVIVFVLLFGLWSIERSFHSVNAGHVGVVYQFGNIVGQRDAGLQTILPWQTMDEANVQVQRTSFDELDSFTSETQDVFIKATINYEVSPADIQDLYRNVGPNYFDKLVPTRLNQIF